VNLTSICLLLDLDLELKWICLFVSESNKYMFVFGFSFRMNKRRLLSNGLGALHTTAVKLRGPWLNSPRKDKLEVH
jgi:hypothetical protein